MTELHDGDPWEQQADAFGKALDELAEATLELVKSSTYKLPKDLNKMSRDQMIFNLGCCLGIAMRMQSVLKRVGRSVEHDESDEGSDE